MGRKIFETTDEQFDIFEEAVIYWIDFFGILDADIVVTHEDIEIDDAEGCCSGNPSNRIFNICLNKVISDSGHGNYLTNNNIKEIAAHEVLEVFFYPLRGLALDGRGDWTQVDTEVHRIIRTFENVLLRPIIEDDSIEENECSAEDLSTDDLIDQIEMLETNIAAMGEHLGELELILDDRAEEEGDCDSECEECTNTDCKCYDCAGDDCDGCEDEADEDAPVTKKDIEKMMLSMIAKMKTDGSI